jgi:hypothetical protein
LSVGATEEEERITLYETVANLIIAAWEIG